jgi:histidinol-phosphate aminotransferase
VVVDEAYAEYVTADDYATAIPHALERDNVVVTRTFSKVYGLAGLRIGYALGHPATLDMLRRSQNPFAVTSLAQIAAIEALRYPDRVEQRVKDNAAGREWLEAELHDRGVTAVPSQANFVFVVPEGDPGVIADGMLERGVIIRLMGPYLRISVGTETENERFIAAWDEMAAG